MRWFKHMSGSHNDEALCRLMDEFGLEGYGAYWIVLETIAAQCDKSDKTSITLSIKNWRKIVPFAPQKLTKWLAFAEQLTLFCVEIQENLITVSCPKLLKYRDEYSERRAKKSGECRDKIPPDTDTDTELDSEKDQEKGRNTVGQEAESSELKPMNIFAEEPTSAQEPEQEPDDPEYSGFTVYHAEGEMRINKRDFAAWQKAYSNLDLAAELQALSDWTRETREWSKKSAFMACSAALRKKNTQSKRPEDTRWHKFRPWAERYHAQRNALLGTDDPETQETLDAGAKVLAEYITPDGFSEDEAGRIIAWLLSRPERAAHVPALANLTDEVPGWGMLISWASNGSKGLDVGDDPRMWRGAANG